MNYKTIKIEKLKKKINGMLLHSVDSYKNGREMLISLLENILMESGNYRGFRHLSQDEMREKSEGGCTYGIFINPDKTYHFKGTDHTRVEYL